MLEKSFFEYLGIADMERIHSQMLAWIFSNDCKALDLRQKNEIFQQIFQVPLLFDGVKIQTEYKRIDLVFETSDSIVAIENKIKSSQHSEQLRKYKEIIENDFVGKNPNLFFLTLINENSNCYPWVEITYSEIHSAFEKITLNTNKAHSVILNEYLKFIRRLLNVLVDFERNPENFDDVFKNGNKTKYEKKKIIFNDPNNQFVSDNQLETILQKNFLNRLSNKFNGFKINVLETRGDALIDFIIEENIEFRGSFYTTFVQLQLENIKFSFSVYGENYVSSKKEWVKDLDQIFKDFTNNNAEGYKRVNQGKTKAYISISRNFGKYWLMNEIELIQKINEELAKAKLLTQELKIKLNAMVKKKEVN